MSTVSPLSPKKSVPLTATSSTSPPNLSTSSLLETVPTPVLRVLSNFSPLIHATHSLIRLITWSSNGKKASSSNSRSILLLLSWWFICLFSYEILRYFPQSILLSSIGYYGILEFTGKSKGNSNASAKTFNNSNKTIITTPAINTLLLELTEISDFFSTLSNHFITPFFGLISWKDGKKTKAFGIFLLTTWPIWLICFFDIRSLTGSLPSVLFRIPAFKSGGCAMKWLTEKSIQACEKLELKAKTIKFCSEKVPQLLPLLNSIREQIQTSTSIQLCLSIIFSTCSLISNFLISTLSLLSISSSSPSSSFPSFSLFPLYPLFSLTLRSFFLITGTLILTWCSPWAALIRHALWKSAIIRRSVRGFVRIFSGGMRPSRAFGRGNQTDEEVDLFGLGTGRERPSFVERSRSTGKVEKVKGKKGSKNVEKAEEEEKVTRHEDVIYQFSIFENQRWWMGLDWTAALLPQERPSWSDESNNAVSPPSSFSLPPAKITLTSSTSIPSTFNRRLVKWQWLDPEWVVSGAGFVSSSVFNHGNPDPDVSNPSEKSSYLDDALSRIRATKSAGPLQTSFSSDSTLFSKSQELDISSTQESISSLPSGSGNAGELSVDVLDVDPEGWQYGDNGWEKMSKKSGMGRYTRRRKWVRRAVLVEILEKGLPENEIDERELKDWRKENGVGIDENEEVKILQDDEDPEGNDTETEDENRRLEIKTSTSMPTGINSVGIGNSGLAGGNHSSGVMVSSPTGNDLKSRLARAAASSPPPSS